MKIGLKQNISLVGYTGFVGSNILMGADGQINGLYNSRNIEEAYNSSPDILIYAGLRAEKYLANRDPDADMQLIKDAIYNIERIKPRKIVLISTIDVFKTAICVDENSDIKTEGLHAYGYDRYVLECKVRELFSDALIIRLPGLFGKNIKKNFIYDYIHIIPKMISEDRFSELLCIKDGIDFEEFYKKENNGFYTLQNGIVESEKLTLKQFFQNNRFNALSFTDSRAIFQFYDLSRLWNDMCLAMMNEIKLLHLATEPVRSSELYKYLSGNDFQNEISDCPPNYDFRTIYFDLYGGKKGYISDKTTVMDEIRRFVIHEQGKG